MTQHPHGRGPSGTGGTQGYQRAANSRESRDPYVSRGPVAGGHLCTGCGDVFSGLAAFDRHQLGTGSPGDDNPVRCLEPAERGLRRTSKSYGAAWSQPSPSRRVSN